MQFGGKTLHLQIVFCKRKIKVGREAEPYISNISLSLKSSSIILIARLAIFLPKIRVRKVRQAQRKIRFKKEG